MKGLERMRRLLFKSKLHLKRASPTILTCIGAAGVVATAVMAARATPKAMELCEMLRLYKVKNDEDEPSRAEYVKAAGPAYIPAALVGVATISCIFGANAISRRQTAAITSAYMLLDSAYREYRDKAKQALGEDAAAQIRELIAKDKYEIGEYDFTESGERQVFYEEFYGKFFERSKEEVLSAEYHFNRNFKLRGYATLNEFYEFLSLPKTELGEALGWSLGAGEEFYGYSWVDFEHRKVTLDDGLECLTIEMPFAPTADYLDF
jgi:hypothetical protein